MSNTENSDLSSSFGATDTVMNSFTVQNNHLDSKKKLHKFFSQLPIFTYQVRPLN